MKHTTTIVGLMLSSMLAPLPVLAQEGSLWQEIQDRGSIRCGSMTAFSPGSWKVDGPEQYEGTSINFCREIAADLSQDMGLFTFKSTANNEFTGEIVTLSVQAKNVRIAPDTRASGENAPSHRVFVGRAEIGAAWSKTSNEGRSYLSLKVDDPSFSNPIYANLFEDEDGDAHSLIWSRPNRRASE